VNPSALTEATEDAEFVAEAAGYVDALDREVADWADHCTGASVQRAFRAMHTLKGAAGFIGEDHVEMLAHAVEEVISTCIEGALQSVDGPTLRRIRTLTKALRRELGLHVVTGSEIPESRPRELAGEAFVSLLRQARRLAGEHGKHVQVCLSGTKVRVPIHLVECLRGPLSHVLRNAVAHAVEPPRVRASFGKPYFATLLIEVEEGPHELFIRIRDDGCGFDLGALKERVVKRGLATEQATVGMTTTELIELAFLPGVSTAHEVSALAGRGMGLEAARAAIEAIGGTLVLTTERHVGTTVVIRVPRTERQANVG